MTWPSNQPEHKPLSSDEIKALNERFAKTDAQAGIEVTPEFQPFEQRNDMFTRAFWDKEVMSEESLGFFKSYRMKFAMRRGDGFSQKDFALRNAAWSVSDIISSRSQEQGKREGFKHRLNMTRQLHGRKPNLERLLLNH